MIQKLFKKFYKILLGKLKKKVPVMIPVMQGKLLENRVALITGGTSGIGYSIAESFLRNGAYVVITGRNVVKINESIKRLSQFYGKEKIFGMEMDNSNIESINSGFKDIQQKIFPLQIDILVNNAGIMDYKSFGDMTQEVFDSVINTNLRGTYFLSKIVGEYMRQNKINGNILNVASSSSLRPAVTPYALSKWSIKGFTVGLAKLLIPYGIVVNGIAPGPTATPMLLNNNTDDIKRQESPSGRYIMPEEIANIATVLVSSMGRMIVGDIIYITGGSGIITQDDVAYTF